jgi:hypothetical protein
MKKPMDHAMELIGLGLKVVPVHTPINKNGVIVCTCTQGAGCRSIGKHPIPNKWVEAASKETDSVKAWWRNFRTANLGVVAGSQSGIVVVDIDPRHGGNDSLDDLQAKKGKLPDTATVITGSGGLHIYFKHPGGVVKNSAGALGLGIDVRGDGGFVVGPGSLHASGGYYEWEASSEPADVGFAEMPQWLQKLIYEPPKAKAQQVDSDSPVIEGGRNVWLTSLAGAIRRKGCGYKPIFAALWYANVEACNPPLDRDEVERIARSILRYAH